MYSRVWRFALLALVVVGAACSSKNEDERAQSAAPSEIAAAASTGNADAPAASGLLQIKDLGVAADLFVAGSKALPRAEFDQTALLKSLGNDPEKIFKWVRDRTWWAPYRGLLRGAKGVMLDRVGSNLDRAALLGDLMRRSGYNVRLAHAELSDTRARELLPKVRAIPPGRLGSAEPQSLPAEFQQGIENIIPGLADSRQEAVESQKRRVEEAEAIIRNQTDKLYAAVRDAARASPANDVSAIAALQDHWWVEYSSGDEWIAMDVVLPDASVGSTLVASESTSDWPKSKQAPSIPDDDWHSVQIQVVVERYENGATSEFTVLEAVLRPAEVLETPVSLGHLPRPWPESINPNGDPNAFRSPLLWVSEWTPFLKVGSEYVVQSGFTDRGELKRNPLDPIGQLGGGGIMGGMDAALGGGEDAETYATAEWIDYEVRVPGAKNEHLRRPIFDLLGPTKRLTASGGFELSDSLKFERAQSLWSRTDILLQPCEFTEAFVAELNSASFVDLQEKLKRLAKESDPAKAKTLATNILEQVEIWGPLPEVAFLRSSLGKKQSRSFIDRPNVLNYRINGAEWYRDGWVHRSMIDIASNSMGMPHDAGGGAFHARLEQGVTDTVAELFALASNIHAAENTASVFAMSPESFANSLLIRAGETSQTRDFQWLPDATARLEQDVKAGFIALALKDPVILDGRQRVGWWRVNPVTGETIGVMDTGFHTSAETTAKLVALGGMLNAFLQKYPIPPMAPNQTVLQWFTQTAGLRVLHQAALQTLGNMANYFMN